MMCEQNKPSKCILIFIYTQIRDAVELWKEEELIISCFLEYLLALENDVCYEKTCDTE